MTASRARAWARRHPIVAAVLAIAALVIAWRVLPWLILAAVLVLACRRWQLHGRAWAWVTRPRPVRARVISTELAELAELRRERDQLRADLAAAELARDVAWDAAASAPPRREPAGDTRARLIAQPLSGARPLGT